MTGPTWWTWSAISSERSRRSRANSGAPAARSGFEDRACAWLKTADGVDIFLEAAGGRDYFVFELEISGTRGKIVIGNGYESLILSRQSRLYTGFRDLAEAPFPAYRRNNCFSELYREAKRALSGRRRAGHFHRAPTATAPSR